MTNGNTVYTAIEDTFQDKCFEELGVEQPSRELDDDLGLPIVQKETIWTKYGVVCEPDKNDFHQSLHDQFERKGYLSPKQINALR